MIKLLIPFLLLTSFSSQVNALPGKQNEPQTHEANKIIVPIGGNTWTINGGKITNAGLVDWSSTSTKVNIYVNLSQNGTLNLSLNLNPGGKNKLKVTIQGISKDVTVEGSEEKEFYIGNGIMLNLDM